MDRSRSVLSSVAALLFALIACSAEARPPAHAAADADLSARVTPILPAGEGGALMRHVGRADKSGLRVPPGTMAKSGTIAVAQAAGDWLLTQQQPGGDFPWTPYETTTYRNTQGATALSLLRLYQHTGDPTHLAGALANGDCQLAGNACITDLQFANNSKHRFSTHDAYFLQQLSAISGQPQYAQLAATDF